MPSQEENDLNMESSEAKPSDETTPSVTPILAEDRLLAAKEERKKKRESINTEETRSPPSSVNPGTRFLLSQPNGDTKELEAQSSPTNIRRDASVTFAQEEPKFLKSNLFDNIDRRSITDAIHISRNADRATEKHEHSAGLDETSAKSPPESMAKSPISSAVLDSKSDARKRRVSVVEIATRPQSTTSDLSLTLRTSDLALSRASMTPRLSFSGAARASAFLARASLRPAPAQPPPPQHAFKVLRRNYDDVSPIASEIIAGRSSRASFVGRRSQLLRISTSDLRHLLDVDERRLQQRDSDERRLQQRDSDERRLQQRDSDERRLQQRDSDERRLQQRAESDNERDRDRERERERRETVKLLRPDELDDPLRLSPIPWPGEWPGEWPTLTEVRRAWDVGREYRSVYTGTWGPYSTPEGYGTLTRPGKVEYEGEFQDGTCHGQGALHYPNGAIVRGTWNRGHLQQPSYVASDGLEFDPEGPYCKMPDRRFYTEILNGLRPAGRSQLTNAHPPRPVPAGCYDAEDGIFDPRRNCVYDPISLQVIRVPTTDEMEWIKQNCRKGWDENVGFRPDLYENWWEPEEELPAEEEEEEEAEEEEEEEEKELEEEMEEEELEEELELPRPEAFLDKFEEEYEEEPLPAHMAERYPPMAVQDVALDTTEPEDIYPFLFPETEEEGKTVEEKLMIPVSTELSPENLKVRQRYQVALEAERAAAEAEEEMEFEKEEEEPKEEEKKAEGETPPSTPRLSLDESEEVYKGPWRHVARRLVPMLRQRLEEDRKMAAAKWQEDLVQLLTERASAAGLEMSTSGYMGAEASVSELSRPRVSRIIFPPGLEERARQRRAEREEREREAEEKRQAEAQAKLKAKEEGRRAAAEGSDSDSDAGADAAVAGADLEADGAGEGAMRRRSSVLPTTAQLAPKGGARVSLASDDAAAGGRAALRKQSRRLAFKEDEDHFDV